VQAAATLSAPLLTTAHSWEADDPHPVVHKPLQELVTGQPVALVRAAWGLARRAERFVCAARNMTGPTKREPGEVSKSALFAWAK
jgi:hypothetical protein